MNSVFNEQPSRKITQDFIDKAVGEAALSYGVSVPLTKQVNNGSFCTVHTVDVPFFFLNLFLSLNMTVLHGKPAKWLKYCF